MNGKIVNSIVGKVDGTIAKTFKSEGTFGFDPSFVPNLPSKFSQENGKSYDEISPEIKNQISHRALAFNELKNVLLKQNGGIKTSNRRINRKTSKRTSKITNKKTRKISKKTSKKIVKNK